MELTTTLKHFGESKIDSRSLSEAIDEAFVRLEIIDGNLSFVVAYGDDISTGCDMATYRIDLKPMIDTFMFFNDEVECARQITDQLDALSAEIKSVWLSYDES